MTIAHAIGVEQVTVTVSGVSLDDFKDGILIVNAGTGVGEVHRIKGNSATVSGVILVDFHPGDGLVIAWSTSETVSPTFSAWPALKAWACLWSMCIYDPALQTRTRNDLSQTHHSLWRSSTNWLMCR